MSKRADAAGSPFWGDADDTEARERYRALVNAVDDGIFQLDPDGAVDGSNDRFVELTGYSRDELLGEHVSRFFDDEDYPAIEDEIDRLHAGPDDGGGRLELTLETATGEQVPCELRVNVLESAGTQQGTVGVVRDVTDRKGAQQRLEEERDMFAEGPAVVFRWQNAEEWPVEQVSENVESVFGYTPAELESGDVPYTDLLLDGELDRIAREVETNSDATTERFSHEPYRVKTKSGDVRWVRDVTKIIRDDTGEITHYLGYLVDITERKRREQHLERYKTIVEAVNDGVYVVDEAGTFRMVNESYAEMLGYDRDELIGRDASAVIDDDLIERVEALHEATTAGDVEQPSMEAEIRTADGEPLPVEATFAPLSEGDDTDWHRVGVVRDVSERRERERAIEESERRYRAIVENFPNGSVGLFDEDLRFTAAGGQLFDRLDYDPEDRIGRQLSEVQPPDVLEEVEPHFRTALEGDVNFFEIDFAGRHLHGNTLPVRDADGEIFAGMVVIQDVTERRKYERKLESSNERLEQFAYAVSHDLQEPLRMVSSYLGLIERRYAHDLDEDGREFLEFALDGADRMRNMIQGLLEYSRVDTRGEPFETVDLDAVFADVREDLRVRIDETDAAITAEPLPRVEGDREQLRQVFQNLLDNAIEYSGDEQPQVSVSCERDGNWWHVSVADEGIGIDPDDADRIFEVFQRLHAPDEHAGTGIGLSLCERIVERHGGDIWMESEPGDGSTVTFSLPAAGDNGE